MSDHDVKALKEFRAELDMSDVEAARARVRHKIARTVDSPPPRRRWIPAIATAATAAAVLVGTTVLLQPGKSGDNQTGVQAGAQPTASGTPAPTASGPVVLPTAPLPKETTPGTTNPVNLPRAEAAPLTAQGLTVGPGQLLYITIKNNGSKQEEWAEPDGMIVIAIQQTTPEGQVIFGLDEAAMQNDIAPQREAFAKNGPSLKLPTAQFLAGLPTDPAALRRKLVETFANNEGKMVFKGMSDWLYRVEPVLTPRVRAALVKALDSLPNVRVDHSARTFDGRSVYIVEQKDSGGREGLIVDVATDRIIGSYAVGPGFDPFAVGATRWEYAVVNR